MSENKILKELDEKIQENIKRYIKDSETHIRLAGTEERIQACKEYVLGLTEIYEKYSQMPAYCDCASSSLKYLSEKENIEKAKEEAEQKLGCYDGVAFACYEIMVDVIIDLLKKCNYSYKDSLRVTDKLREKITKLAYENSTNMKEGKNEREPKECPQKNGHDTTRSS